MEKKFRSSCAIASTLDLLGDKWSLILVRDMLIKEKRTFKEFSSSAEGIASGILASRLKLLESFGFITKRKLPDNQKENIYLLTDKGIDLAPIILEISLWGQKYMKEFNSDLNTISGLQADKNVVISTVQNNYRQAVAAVIG